MGDFTCSKCGGTDYGRNETRAEGGLLSSAFDISTNRFFAVSCERCGFTEPYRKDVSSGSKVFDFLASQAQSAVTSRACSARSSP